MEKSDLIGTRVALNPQHFGAGVTNGLPGRRGTVIGFDENAHGWPIIELDIKGRERKPKRVAMPIHILVELNEKNTKALDKWESMQ